MLNIPEYKEYGGETKIALMDNSSLAFMHELSQRSYPSDGILSVYDLILIPKWVMEEIEDSTYRSTYVEQLQAQGYPIRWIDETKYGAFVNDEDVNLYYIVEAAVSRVSELMRFLRRKVKTEDLIDLPSAEEWMNRLYDEWPIHGRTLSKPYSSSCIVIAFFGHMLEQAPHPQHSVLSLYKVIILFYRRVFAYKVTKVRKYLIQ